MCQKTDSALFMAQTTMRIIQWKQIHRVPIITVGRINKTEYVQKKVCQKSSRTPLTKVIWNPYYEFHWSNLFVHIPSFLCLAFMQSWKDSSRILLSSVITAIFKKSFTDDSLELGKRGAGQGQVSRKFGPTWRGSAQPRIVGCSGHCEQTCCRGETAVGLPCHNFCLFNGIKYHRMSSQSGPQWRGKLIAYSLGVTCTVQNSCSFLSSIVCSSTSMLLLLFVFHLYNNKKAQKKQVFLDHFIYILSSWCF